MPESPPWEIDRLAAARLLAELGLAADGGAQDRVAAHFAKHRREAATWSVERAREALVRILEREATERLPRENEYWARGFGQAEILVASLSVQDVLEEPHGAPRSQGTILRDMIRAAKQG